MIWEHWNGLMKVSEPEQYGMENGKDTKMSNTTTLHYRNTQNAGKMKNTFILDTKCDNK